MRAGLRRAAAALLAACAACRPHATTALSLTVSPPAAAPGDTVRLVLAVANPGADTLRLAFEPGCAVRFSVHHAAEGWRAHPVPDPCLAPAAGDSARVVIAPGATWRAERAWAIAAEDARHPLVPGTYRVAASLAQRVEVRGGRAAFQLGEAAPEATLIVR